MFRGKESSNRIEISLLVQDLLNFGVLGSLRLWGCGVVGGAPPHTCTHMCMHTDTHIHVKHDNFNYKWLPPLNLGKSREFPMMSYACAHVCTCVHVCVWV